jgi:hypothetical protein
VDEGVRDERASGTEHEHLPDRRPVRRSWDHEGFVVITGFVVLWGLRPEVSLDGILYAPFWDEVGLNGNKKGKAPATAVRINIGVNIIEREYQNSSEGPTNMR